MILEQLRVIHSKNASFAKPEGDHFWVQTCQRRICVTVASANVFEFPNFFSRDAFSRDVFKGRDAYRFLLEMATGLQSEVQGETDVFGQLKEAWSKFEAEGSACARSLLPWIQKLFEDTKEIRKLYIHHVSSGSYGSLVRRLIRLYSGEASAVDSVQELTGPILIVGAGQIAQSIAPLLAGTELLVWNRTLATAQTMAEDLRKRHHANVRVLETEEEFKNAWKIAAHVAVCVPFHADRDHQWIQWWKEGLSARPSTTSRGIIHLGGTRDQSGEWNRLPNFHPLDDLFEMQKLQNEAREDQFSKAWKACSEKSLLRALPGSLNGSLSLPHGWEDLQNFA